MAIQATAQNPDEVRILFNKYADVLEMYASDQEACQRWQSTKREATACELKAATYREIAAEMREIEFSKEAQP
jgi:hypothetical protein